MTSPEHIAAAIAHAYKLESLLRTLSLAADGAEIAGRSFEQSGGGVAIDMAADMVAEIIDGLEAGGRNPGASRPD